MQLSRSRNPVRRTLTGWSGVLALLLPALLLMAVFAEAKDEFWDKKPYDEWSQKECQKLLTNSPWAKEYEITGTQMIGSLGGRDATDNQPPYIKYQVQIRTAPPIRQAMVRMMQIAQNYDQLPDEQKKQFDQQTQGFLAADTSEMIIVHMSYSTNFPQNYRDLAQHWQSQTAELLKNSVYLSGNKSDKVAIAQYIPGQEGQSEFQFIFPRKVDGKDIVGDQDKNLRLEFAYPVVGRIGDGRGFLEFKLDKMMFNGNIVY
ncbi:MAG: hypothetical protein GXY47_15245 [Acidobacteria bacterium]|nr:hypothetical protein [Acidobacteriota bacterium]